MEWSHELESWIGAMEWSIRVDSWSGVLEWILEVELWSEMLEIKRNIYSGGNISLVERTP